MIHSMDGIIDAKDTNQKVTIGNGQSIHETKKGKLRAYYVSKDGEKKKILLHNVEVVPDLAPFNSFSITAALESGIKLGNEGKQIYLKRGDFHLKFDHEISTKGGYVAGVKVIPRHTAITEIATPAMSIG
jgi:hypothetical protein